MDSILAFLAFAFLAAVVAGLPCALIGLLIAHLVNGRTGAGFWLGFCLGPLGWIIVCFLRDLRPKMPTRSIHAAPLESVAGGEHFCMPCGVDALSSIELGSPVWRCPSCGRSV